MRQKSRSVKEWIKFCQKNANDHGFQIVWTRQAGPLNPIEKLMKIVSECGEAMEAYVAQTLPDTPENPINCTNWREHFDEEMADIFVRYCHMVGDLKIDIEGALEKKMKKNKKRPQKHGKLT